jgi:hypothetical protein
MPLIILAAGLFMRSDTPENKGASAGSEAEQPRLLQPNSPPVPDGEIAKFGIQPPPPPVNAAPSKPVDKPNGEVSVLLEELNVLAEDNANSNQDSNKSEPNKMDELPKETTAAKNNETVPKNVQDPSGTDDWRSEVKDADQSVLNNSGNGKDSIIYYLSLSNLSPEELRSTVCSAKSKKHSADVIAPIIAKSGCLWRLNKNEKYILKVVNANYEPVEINVDTSDVNRQKLIMPMRSKVKQ